MKTYYVVWRGDEDDFFVTALKLSKSDIERGMDWVIAKAYEVEYPSTEGHPENPYLGDDGGSYECVTIFTGQRVDFLY